MLSLRVFLPFPVCPLICPNPLRSPTPCVVVRSQKLHLILIFPPYLLAGLVKLLALTPCYLATTSQSHLVLAPCLDYLRLSLRFIAYTKVSPVVANSCFQRRLCAGFPSLDSEHFSGGSYPKALPTSTFPANFHQPFSVSLPTLEVKTLVSRRELL